MNSIMQIPGMSSSGSPDLLQSLLSLIIVLALLAGSLFVAYLIYKKYAMPGPCSEKTSFSKSDGIGPFLSFDKLIGPKFFPFLYIWLVLISTLGWILFLLSSIVTIFGFAATGTEIKTWLPMLLYLIVFVVIGYVVCQLAMRLFYEGVLLLYMIFDKLKQGKIQQEHPASVEVHSAPAVVPGTCPNCGYVNSNDALFCRKCGNRL